MVMARRNLMGGESQSEKIQRLIDYAIARSTNSPSYLGEMFIIPEITGEVSASAFYSFYGSVTLENVTSTTTGFQYFAGKSVILPRCEKVFGYGFRQSPNLENVRLDNCTELAYWNNIFNGCPNLVDVYVPKIAHTAPMFPWGITNPLCVIHCSDGDFDKNGNPIGTEFAGGGV